MTDSSMRVALAQLRARLLQREAALEAVMQAMVDAAGQGARLVVFGEALVPGYPWWIERIDGSRFDHPLMRQLHAQYLDQAVCIEAGHLDQVCAVAADLQIACYLGIIERPLDRAGHSLYASLVYIDPEGKIQSVHRKLMPTHEERLAWAPGDGHGLKVHSLGPFTLGGLNCWENWMPLPRASLYAQGENLHVAVWPGSDGLTRDITRFIAREARSFVVSVGNVMHSDDLDADFPGRDRLQSPQHAGVWANGGSCVAGPDGAWLLEPQTDGEGLWVVDLRIHQVLEARKLFDPSGHYSRADVTCLEVDRRRKAVARFIDG